MQSERCLRQRGDLPCIPHPRLQAFCRDTADDARYEPGREGVGACFTFCCRDVPRNHCSPCKDPCEQPGKAKLSSERGSEPHRDADGGVNGLRTWGIEQKTSLGIRFPLASCAAEVERGNKRGGRSVGPQGTPKGQSSLLRAARPQPAGNSRFRTNSKQTRNISPWGIRGASPAPFSPFFLHRITNTANPRGEAGALVLIRFQQPPAHRSKLRAAERGWHPPPGGKKKPYKDQAPLHRSFSHQVRPKILSAAQPAHVHIRESLG